MKKYSIGVDIGGGHISCALVDLKTGKIIDDSLVSENIDNKGTAEEILNGWSGALKQVISKVEVDELAGIGFGIPGPFEYDKGIARFAQVEKFYGLDGVDVATGLSSKLGLSSDTPLRFMNDASAFAAGEAWQGSASDVRKSVSITLGTGFGSAFVSDGVPVVEGELVPKMGCVWHLPFEDGIADDYFSTRWFIKRYKEETGLDVDGAKPIADASDTDEKAMGIFKEYGRNMGEFFSPWLKKFGADVLVIGGNIAGSYHLFGPDFENALSANGVETKIKLSTLKEDAAIIGSARMLDPVYWEKIKPILPKM